MDASAPLARRSAGVMRCDGESDAVDKAAGEAEVMGAAGPTMQSRLLSAKAQPHRGGASGTGMPGRGTGHTPAVGDVRGMGPSTYHGGLP